MNNHYQKTLLLGRSDHKALREGENMSYLNDTQGKSREVKEE